VDPLPDLAPPAPPPAPARKSALAFFGVLLALWVPGALAQAATLPLGLAWTEVFAFLLSALVATAGSNLRAAPYLRLGRVRPAALALGGLAGAAGYLFAGSLLALTQRMFSPRVVEAFDPGRLFEGSRPERLALAAVATLLAPVCEEIAFRGYVQTTLGLRRGPAAAIAGSAVLFALLHMNPVLFPALAVLGAVFGWLAWRAGSIWPAVLAHAVNNAITSSSVFGDRTPPPDSPPLSAVAVTLAVGAVGLLVVVAAFRAATSEPAPLAGAIVLRDPGDPSIRFTLARVPPRLLAATVLGATLLAALLVAHLLGGRVRWR
jgi:membrane protease YdiL (CAAX protease family)